MFAISVEMFSCVPDEPDMEYCGSFFWGDGFSIGKTILFYTASAALHFMFQNKVEDVVPGFEYRYRIVKVDNSDGAFNRDVTNWE